MRILILAVGVLGIPSISLGQWTVFDPQALVQTRSTASQLVQMSTRLPGMERLRIPPPLPVPVYVPRSVEELIRVAIPPAAYRLMASHAADINRASEIILRTKAAIDNARVLDPSIIRTVSDLERIVTTTTATRGLSGIMDSLAATSVVNQRQTQMNGALLASLVEMQAAREQREMDDRILALREHAWLTAPVEYGNEPEQWMKWRLPR